MCFRIPFVYRQDVFEIELICSFDFCLVGCRSFQVVGIVLHFFSCYCRWVLRIVRFSSLTGVRIHVFSVSFFVWVCLRNRFVFLWTLVWVLFGDWCILIRMWVSFLRLEITRKRGILVVLWWICCIGVSFLVGFSLVLCVVIEILFRWREDAVFILLSRFGMTFLFGCFIRQNMLAFFLRK